VTTIEMTMTMMASKNRRMTMEAPATWQGQVRRVTVQRRPQEKRTRMMRANKPTQ
jgi:hypothetical protein